MKKILSLLVVLGMLFSSFPVISQAAVLSLYDETEAKELLSALNIIDEDMTPKVTRDIFVESLMRFIYDDASVTGKPEDFLKANNMLDEKLAVTSTITVHEAIKYAVIILGYRIKAETEGGYPSGYLKAASDLKLTEGIAVGENSVMRQSQMLRLLYNMLDAEPLEMQFSNASNVSYEVAKNETLLSMYRHIYRIEGIQTANEHTSIYNEEGVRDGYIKIDDTLYETKVSKDFLGEYVIGYVQEDKYDELSVIFLSSHKGKNNILTLDTEDIEDINDKFTELKYYNEKDKLKTVKISATPTVILNGVLYDEYTKNDFTPDIGSVKLIDNNDDGTYEVVNIVSYQTMIVDSTDKTDLIIRGKYGFDGALDYLDLGDDDLSLQVIKDETDITFKDIQYGDVLSVAISRNNGDKVCKIYVKTESVTGKVTSLNNNEDECVIDGVTYKISSDLEKYLAFKNTTISLSKDYIFYLDYFGNLAYYNLQPAETYVVFMKTYKDMDLDESVHIKYMDLDEEWHVDKLAEKVKYDGTRMNADAVYEALNGLTPQIIIIKKNLKEEIREIQVAHITSEADKDKFTATREMSYQYIGERNNFNDKLFFDSNAKIVIIPTDNSMDTENYWVENSSSFLKWGRSYTVVAYDRDKFGYSALYTLRWDEDQSKNHYMSDLFIITDIYQGLNADDEVVQFAEGFMGNLRNLNFPVKTDGMLDGYKEGDIVRIHLDAKGRIDAIDSTYHYSLADDFVTRYENINQTYAMLAGKISDIAINEQKIKINVGSDIVMKLPASMVVKVFDADNKKCRWESVECLQTNDNIVVRTNQYGIQEIIKVERER